MVNRVIPVLERTSESPKCAVNVVPLAQSIILDCTTAFAFGVPLALDLITNEASRNEWLKQFLVAFPNDQSLFWLRDHPKLTKYLCVLDLPLVSAKRASARREFEAWALCKVDSAEEALKRQDQGQLFEAGHLPVLYDAVRQDLAKPFANAGKSFEMTEAQRRELASECFDHIGKLQTANGTISQS